MEREQSLEAWQHLLVGLGHALDTRGSCIIIITCRNGAEHATACAECTANDYLNTCVTSSVINALVNIKIFTQPGAQSTALQEGVHSSRPSPVTISGLSTYVVLLSDLF